MSCDLCADFADYCGCSDVVLVKKTHMVSYSDGIDRPYTDTLPLCLECRFLFYAEGDIIVAV